MTTPNPLDPVHAVIRGVGGIVHWDGNIFFTSKDQLFKAIAALEAQRPPAGYAATPGVPTKQIIEAITGKCAEELYTAAVPAGYAIVPVEMLLFCPDCGRQHIDSPDESQGWTNPPHKSHLCHGCGCIWRPANTPTNGIACGVLRGRDDTWLLGNGAIPTAPASLESLIRSCYDDAAQYPEMEDPRTSDWMYGDNHECAEAIRKRGVETAKHYVELAAAPAIVPPHSRTLEQSDEHLSMAIGTIQGMRGKSPYTDSSPIGKFVTEVVEYLRDWRFSNPAAPAITPAPEQDAPLKKLPSWSKLKSAGEGEQK